MAHRIACVSMLALLALAGCGERAADDARPETTQESAFSERAAKLEQIYADYHQDYLRMSPIMATFFGEDAYNDQWFPSDPLSDEYLTANYEMQRRYLDRINAIDPEGLDETARSNYEIFRLGRQQAIERYERGFDRFEALTPIDQFSSLPSFLVVLGSGSSVQPFETPADYDAWLSRSMPFPEHVETTIMRMREGVELGIVEPKILMEKTLPQLAAHVVESAEDSVFWQPILNMPVDFPDADRDRLTEAYREHIEDRLIPAYARLHDYISKEYLPEARDSIGQSEVPGGADYYAFVVRETTTTDYTPEEIHEIGKREVARIYAEMEKIRDKVGFEGDMQAFFDFLRTDPRFYYDSEEELLEAYETLGMEIDAELPKLFRDIPETPYIMKPVEEFRAESMAAAQYFPGSPDGSRPGVFYVNTFDLPSRPNYQMEALSLHEANPGHHFQIMIAWEMEDLPAFRRLAFYTAFIEGWGLYAESLGPELGLYEDPYQHFGWLYNDMLRANRLVVDTGMHALGWSRQEAIDWMRKYSSMPDTDLIAEVDRYIAIPSQALAYKIGALKIRELRTRAEEAFGDDFDVREFHHQVLSTGALPLFVLEDKIDRWIAANTRG